MNSANLCLRVFYRIIPYRLGDTCVHECLKRAPSCCSYCTLQYNVFNSTLFLSFTFRLIQLLICVFWFLLPTHAARITIWIMTSLRSSSFSSRPLLGLRQLSDSVYLYEPFDSVGNLEPAGDHVVNHAAPSDEGATVATFASLGPAAPKFIILITWMDAAPRHILKYVAGYQKLYPTSRLLLIRSSAPDWFWRSQRVQQSRIDPGIAVINSICRGHGPNSQSNRSGPTHRVSPPERAEILLHVYSNGGSNQACSLLRTYLERTSRTLPPHVTVFDSCPGRGTFKRSMRALSSVLPRSLWSRIPLYICFYILLSLYWLAYIPWGFADPIERVRRDFNDASLMSEVRRCYIYSEEDVMIDFHDVEDHAHEAVARGFAVQKAKFQGTGHCAHVRIGDGIQYWNAVRTAWNGAAGAETAGAGFGQVWSTGPRESGPISIVYFVPRYLFNPGPRPRFYLGISVTLYEYHPFGFQL